MGSQHTGDSNLAPRKSLVASVDADSASFAAVRNRSPRRCRASIAMLDGIRTRVGTVLHHAIESLAETATVLHHAIEALAETATVLHHAIEALAETATVLHHTMEALSETATVSLHAIEAPAVTVTVLHHAIETLAETVTVLHHAIEASVATASTPLTPAVAQHFPTHALTLGEAEASRRPRTLGWIPLCELCY